ncbi:MAG: type IV secretion system protein [Candidatus Berkelbacteria bacterium]|nr:type IV secretion system protein [Candidatus Berkelbacteria bacterium]
MKSRKKRFIIFSIFFVSFVVLIFLSMPIIASAASWADCAGAVFTGSILTGIAALLRLSYDFAVLASGVLTMTIKPDFLSKSITSNQTYYATWASVRDIANMGIVLGFVFIGIATTLRFQNYAAQKRLPILIIVAILINFTPLFCGLVIDSSNIIAQNFLKRGNSILTTLQGTDNWLEKQKESVRKAISTPLCNDILGESSSAIDWDRIIEVDWSGIKIFEATKTTTATQGSISAWDYLKNSFFAFIFFTFSGIIFLILGCILLARHAMLILLFIISPLAFFCIIFPFSRKHFDTWLSHFLKWCFVGVTTLFCIYIGNQLFGASKKEAFDVFLTCIFFYVGFKLAMKTSGAAGAMMMAAGVAVGGFAVGAVKTVGGKTLGAVGGMAGAAAKQLPGAGAVSSFASSVSQKGGMMLESMGLRKFGTTAATRSKGVNKAQEAMKNMTDAEIKGAVERRGATSAVVAAGMKELASRNKLGTIDSTKLPKLVGKATSRGVDRDVFTKLDPSMAIKDKNNPTHHELDQLAHTVKNTKTPEKRAKLLTQGSPHNLGAMGGEQLNEILANASPNDRKKMYDSVSGGGGLRAQAAYSKVLKAKATAAKSAGRVDEAKRFDEEYVRHAANVKTLQTHRATMPYYKPPTTPVSAASKVGGAIGRGKAKAVKVAKDPGTAARKAVDAAKKGAIKAKDAAGRASDKIADIQEKTDEWIEKKLS